MRLYIKLAAQQHMLASTMTLIRVIAKMMRTGPIVFCVKPGNIFSVVVLLSPIASAATSLAVTSSVKLCAKRLCAKVGASAVDFSIIFGADFVQKIHESYVDVENRKCILQL